MPQAEIDDNGTVLYYEDSGAPAGKVVYTTVIVVHGFVFHSGSFRPLLALAPTHGLRLVLLNTRDYPNSSRLTPDEVSALKSTNQQVQANAIRELGHQIASFLAYFVREHEIPNVHVDSAGKQAGGIVLLSWSFGNLLAMSLLGNVHSLPQETKDLLSRYWRRLVMYDPSLTTLGQPPPEGAYSPLRDTSLSLDERGRVFSTWVSAYYPTVSSVVDYTASDLLARQNLAGTPGFQNSLSSHKRLSTVERMSEEQLKEMTDFGVISRSAEAMRLIPRHVYQDNVRRALWEPEVNPGSEGGITLPDLTVLVLWFSMTMGDCVWAAKVLTDGKIQADRNGGTRRRDVEIECVEGANHFAHWDEPRRIIEILAQRV